MLKKQFKKKKASSPHRFEEKYAREQVIFFVWPNILVHERQICHMHGAVQ